MSSIFYQVNDQVGYVVTSETNDYTLTRNEAGELEVEGDVEIEPRLVEDVGDIPTVDVTKGFTSITMSPETASPGQQQVGILSVAIPSLPGGGQLYIVGSDGQPEMMDDGSLIGEDNPETNLEKEASADVAPSDELKLYQPPPGLN